MPAKKTKKVIKKPKAKKKTVSKKKTAVKRKVAPKRPAKKKVVKKKTVTKKSKTTIKKPAKRMMSKKTAKKKQTTTKKTQKKIAGTKIPVKKGSASEGVYGSVSQITNEDQQKINQIRQQIAQEVAQENDLMFENFAFQEYVEAQPKYNNTSVPEEIMSDEITPDEIEQEYYEDLNKFSHRQKMALMYASITIVMIIVVSFWVVGIKNSMGVDFKESLLQTVAEDETDYEQELNDAFAEFTNNLQGIQQDAEKVKDGYTDLYEETKAKIIEQQLKNNVIDKMKEQINNLDEPLEQDLNLNNNQ